MNFTVFSSLILLSGCILVTQAGLLGDKECTYGPSYWCSSLRNAKQCSAVTHCIQTIWETQTLPEDNDDICNICKNMVKEARDQLQSNQTQEDLKAVFDGSCRLIPLREISTECVKLANEFIPELIETLSSQMNPQIVCATAGLCNSVFVDRLLRDHGMSHNGKPLKAPETNAVVPSSVSEPDPGDCDDCHKYIEDTIKLVREHSKQELLDHLLAICSELGSVSDGCSALMEVNIDAIYNYLANDLNPDDACNLFGMCNEQLYGKVSRPVSANSGDEVCDFCVVIAQHWRDVMTSNTTEEQFQEILEGICFKTGSFADECRSLVDNYYLAAYNYLMNEFDPKKICETVGICPSKVDRPIWTTLHTGPLPANTIIDESSISTNNSVDRSSLHSGQHKHTDLPRAPLLPSIKITVAGEKGVRDGSDQACTMCEFTLHFIQIQLQDKHTKQDIENSVKAVCSYMPKDLEEQCDDYVDAYGDQVIALLQQEIDPSVLCPMLGLCPSNNTVASQVATVKTDVSCVACEFVMVKVKELLANKTNQEAIRHALDNVCGLLPGSVSDECQTFIDENAVEVMELLAGGVDPQQICHLLGLCHNNMASLPALNQSHQLPVSRLFLPSIMASTQNSNALEHGGQSKVCVMCEFVLNILEKLILDNNTRIEDKIQWAVDEVCILLPSTLQEDCLGFVEQYSAAVIRLLLNDLKPSLVCREMHLCQQPNLHGLPRVLVTRSVPEAVAVVVPADDPDATVTEERQCLICKALAVTYKGSNKDFHGDQASITAAINNFCSVLSGSEAQLCSTIDVSSAIGDGSATSSAVCSSLNYCPNPSHLLGSEKCTWGPSYWCQSMLHAQSCGAAPHCQERVWKGTSPPSK